MEQSDRIYQLGVRCLEIRKEVGFLKALPTEVRREAVAIVTEGAPLRAVAKTLGVSRNTLVDWVAKFKPSAKASDSDVIIGFNEVLVIDEKQNFEVKLSTTIQGVRVELIGRDYALLQRLLRKLG